MDYKTTSWKQLLGAAMLGIAAMSAEAGNRLVSLGTGGVTGVYYPAGGAICRLVNLSRSEHGIRCAVESTPGSVSNLRRVRSGDLDLGIAEAGWLYRARQGEGVFTSEGADPNLRTLFSLYTEYFTVLARVGSGVSRFDDVPGKRVSVGKPGSGQRATLELLMAAKGWRMDDFVASLELEPAEQAGALCSGEIDVMLYTVGHPSGATKEATRDCQSRLIAVNGAAIEQLVADSPYLHWAEIPGDTYPGNPDGIKTLAMKATFFSSASLPEDEVYAVVKAVFEHFPRFRRLHPAFAGLDPKDMARGPYAAPLHPGAERYFREVGLLPPLK